MIEIDADFPGGNIVVDRIEGDEVWLRPDLRDTEGWWFHWLCRVRGAAGRTVTFHFTDRNPLTAMGPSVSTDFVHWDWLGAEVEPEGDDSDNVRVTGTLPDADPCYLTYSLPYVESHLTAFLARHADHPHLQLSTLATSEHGRPVERLRLRDPQARAPRKIMLSARRHACESVANYELEGIMDFALDPAHKMLQRAELLIIPFVDKDGVEQGDQGKNRRPHDHNRDYTDAPRYAATRAIIAELDAWADDRFDLSIDLHCPWIRNGRNDAIFFCEPPPAYQPEFHRFCRLLAETNPGPLPFDPADNIGYNVDWNRGDMPSFSRWVQQHAGPRLATSIEFPYGLARGVPVSVDAARTFGRTLARTMLRWLDRDA
jgi:hypothetical protein